MSTPASPTLSLQSTLDPLSPHRATSSTLPLPTASPSATSRSIHDAPPPYDASPMIVPQAGSSRIQARSTPPPPAFHPSDPPLPPVSHSSPLASPSRRHWYPTPNVPMRLQERHAAARVSSDEERNRWLSEDEGVSGVARRIGRRRIRRSNGQRSNDEPFDRDSPPGGPRTGSSDGHPKPRILQGSSVQSRPGVRRAMSFDPQSTPAGPSTAPIGAVDVTVGAFPPRIEHIVPDPHSAVRRHNVETRASGLGLVPVEQAHQAPVESAGKVTHSEPPLDSMTQAQKRKAAQRGTLTKLRRLLSCALCPPVDGEIPSLHHPITLPCGHTMSALHIPIPTPPPLELTSNLPHEIYAAQQRQHQQRLNIWAGVMCPIPTCKRFSPIAATAVYPSDVVVGGSETPTHSRSSSGQGETLASGVLYYPPPSVLPAYTAEAKPRVETNPALLDVTIDKILELVNREMARHEAPEGTRLTHRSHDYEATDTESDEEEPGSSALHTTLSGDMASLGQAAQPSTSRRMAKRQRNLLRRTSHDDDSWQFEKDLRSIVECDVCAMMLYDPVTTPCQHSFCYKCLSRSLDHSSRCPVCRQDLPGFAFFQEHNVNRVLLGIIKTVFGEAYAERQQAIEREERDALLDTPIFVCTLAFPGMPTILHVFEPRYRLMIRRCIESSSPRFGMVLPSRGTSAPGINGVMEYGTMLEIQSVQMLPDGRSMVETVGTHRFKLLEKGNLDGYTVGRIERIDDVSPEEELVLEQQARSGVASGSSHGASASRAPVSIATDTILDIGGPVTMSPAFRLPRGSPIPGATPNQPAATPTPEDESRSTEEYMDICRSFIDQLRSGSAPWLLQRLNNTYGTMPTDPSEFSYWMALVMPIDEYEKAKLLPIRSPRLRLKLIVHWVESLRSSWWFSSGCVVG